MCGTCNGDSAGGNPAATANSTADAPSNATANGVYPAQGQPKSSPYQSVQDYISNVNRFKIIESTLREGEQVSFLPRRRSLAESPPEAKLRSLSVTRPDRL